MRALRGLRTLLLLCSVWWSPGNALANDVETLLAQERPAGVVFEIIAGSISMLDDSLPRLRRDIERLRERFPDLPVAIVSHGREQFALTRANRSEHSVAHDLVQQLVDEERVDVHVCGTHAGWFDIEPEDFPDYVDVSATGPAQINDYLALDYELIVIDE